MPNPTPTTPAGAPLTAAKLDALEQLERDAPRGQQVCDERSGCLAIYRAEDAARYGCLERAESHALFYSRLGAKYDEKDGCWDMSEEARAAARLAVALRNAAPALLAAARRLAKVEADLDRERVRLAGCGVAAIGDKSALDVKPGDYAHSASLDDVVRLRARADKLSDVVRKMKLALWDARHYVMHHPSPDYETGKEVTGDADRAVVMKKVDAALLAEQELEGGS
jgi:hypothetical protein